MSKEYEEFYRNEYPLPDNWGNDPKFGPTINASSSMEGRPIKSGEVGHYIGDGYRGTGSFNYRGGPREDPQTSFNPKPQEKVIIWRTLMTLTASIKLYDILINPDSGKILIDSEKKIIKGFDDSRTWVIEAGLIEGYTWHLDCVVMEFIVNGKIYNESQSNEALSEFFNQGFTKESNSRMFFRTKWQEGHYPPDVSTIHLKIRDVEEDKEEVDNIALTKEFRDSIIVNIEDGNLFFDKHVGA